jgi:hypothetical protein
MLKTICWVTHPKEIGCEYSKIRINDIQFELTASDTFVSINSLVATAHLDSPSMKDSKKIAIKLANVMASLSQGK